MKKTISPYLVDVSKSPHTELKPLSLAEVQCLNGGFWHVWQAKVLRAALAHGYEENLKNHVIANFEVASGRRTGKFKGKWFADSEIYKWIEAAALFLLNHEDKELEEHLDYVIQLIEESQMEDGYLNTFFQLNPEKERWSDMIYGHEQYCAGHLFQAAAAHYRTTGKTSLLDVALLFADHIDSVFGPGKRIEPCGHPEIKMGLLELYRITENKKYLDLAQFLLDQRGKGLLGGEDHHQDHVGVRDAERVAGHAVRQLYLLSGATDIWMETGEARLSEMLKRVWKDMTEKRIHLTGGVGSTPKLRIAKSGDEPYFRGEAFGEDFELPNFNVHNETCAQVASVMWNWRMLLGYGSVEYADLLEWTLYNGALSGLGLDGKSFFYTNPLASKGNLTRQSWFPVACCPPNIMRMVASVQNYFATIDKKGLQLHLYDNAVIHVSNEETPFHGASLKIETKYPWDGLIRITIKKAPQIACQLSLRIPKWVSTYTVTMNGQVEEQGCEGGKYVVLDKIWTESDVIELQLPMEARFVSANPYIESDGGRVAITRGPLVYCFEGIDQGKSVQVADIRVAPGSPINEIWNDNMLGGIMALTVDGSLVDASGWEHSLYKFTDEIITNATKKQLTAIPYYAWANREASSMCVWCSVE